MKNFFTLTLVGLFSGSAYAMPAVNDLNHQDLTITDTATGRIMLDGDLTMELTSYDPVTNLFNIHTVVSNKLDGSRDEQDEPQDKDSFPTESTILLILATCAENGGVREVIVTPAGPFDSCALPVDDDQQVGTIWLGAAPFGQVKLDTISKKKEGYRIQSILRDYRFGDN